MSAALRIMSFLAGLTLTALAFSIPGDQIILAGVGGALTGVPLGMWIASWMGWR